MAGDIEIPDSIKEAISAAVWNEFLYNFDTLIFNGSMARSPTLADADKLAETALRIAAPLIAKAAKAEAREACIARLEAKRKANPASDGQYANAIFAIRSMEVE